MEYKDISIAQYTETRLLQNEFYFRYIYKKTEKIVYTVLYTIRHSADKDISDPILEQLETAAVSLMDAAVASLTAREVEGERVLYGLIESYFMLESRIKMAEAAGRMSSEIASVFFSEIEGVYRAIERMRNEARRAPVTGDTAPFSASRARRPRGVYAGGRTRTSDASRKGGAADTESRRERILAIIRDRKEVAIKDISDIVTDVSEKTIQRELSSLISEGQVVRHGERRWSKYAIAE